MCNVIDSKFNNIWISKLRSSIPVIDGGGKKLFLSHCVFLCEVLIGELNCNVINSKFNLTQD